ncbi:putative oligopeptide ABC transporter periplasmic component [Sodalis glossinidius str. 'morsitans']|uniref:Oligopeptide ABC transporter periplasmic component n=1 Tax=Sodalis glossinidius (strain morsitans) TaxID=343509 RepID=Q2NWQ4_SODGM|nr:putative oligopeptide ABC transporter periplasmic component [Sodalis glossinidius str. 'morsitans']
MVLFPFKVGKKPLLALMLSALSVSPLLTQAATVPAGTPLAAKQEVVRNNGSEPASLDPHKVESDVEFNIISDIFEGLVSVDNDGKIRPRLAERWENDNNTRWVFHLRLGLSWSNGDPITAQDVVYSWRRLVSPATASPYESYLSNMHVLNAQAIIDGKKKPDELGIKALDDQTVEVSLDQPISYFLQMLAHPALVPINKKDVEQFGDKWTQPANIVSSGDYKLEQWVVNEKVVAVRNSRYWDDAHTVVNKVTYLPVASGTADVNRYRAGEIDVIYTVPETLFKSLKKELGPEVHARRSWRCITTNSIFRKRHSTIRGCGWRLI